MSLLQFSYTTMVAKGCPPPGPVGTAKRPSQAEGGGARDSLLAIATCRLLAVADWCFVRAPLVRNRREVETVIYEALTIDPQYNASDVWALTETKGDAFDAANIGLQVRTDAKGDAKGWKEGAIEDAATQALRGLNGLTEFIRTHPGFLIRDPAPGKAVKAVLIPVVFTTATLYLSGADLSTTDVQTGRIDLASASFEPKTWVGYQYHQSPRLTHGAPRPRPSADLGAVLDREFVRTIPMVSPAGIDGFLHWASSVFDT